MKKTIKKQVFQGYIIITFIILLLLSVSLIYLYSINKSDKVVSMNRNNQNATKEAIVLHYEWLDNLNISIQTGKDFSGSLNSNTCSLGKWLASINSEALQDTQIVSTLQLITKPHEEIHTSATKILELSETSREEAYLAYSTEIKPKVTQIISGLSTISNRYKTIADDASTKLSSQIANSIKTSTILTILAIIAAIIFANSISKRISKPIIAVAEWSKKLSMGIEDLEFNMEGSEKDSQNEVGIMINSFKEMAKSIQDNVNVVKKVANGDMTAFVNIRSSRDSLGKNLYQMVQSNDMMFAEILEIASTVASGADKIAHSSEALAQSSTVQAATINEISSIVINAGKLSINNAQKAKFATDISQEIKRNVEYSDNKMKTLVNSVEDIRNASEKISSVIKSIEDIAFQTNLLSLNAAIEAARAGEAGKGFAIVASEVRELALKSSNAADESKALIENAINKTHEGSRISSETSETFAKIITSIDKIVDMVFEIASSSEEQQEKVGKIEVEIERIIQLASDNANISEKSADASHEMHINAETLKQTMSKFNLRQRKEGHAYIPPEKRNDVEFIRQANENYKKAMETGEYNN